MLPLFAQEAADTEPSFSLTSERTYLPGEKPEISVYSHNVSALEFRVYRVNDPVKFFSQMQEMHSFGGRAPALPKQAHTWLEKFHAWKHRLWAWIRDFIRAQFSPESRQKIRLWRDGRRREEDRGPKVESYAQVPVLNQQQVVSVWNWTVPSHERWESQTVAVPVSDKGVYLVEATNGTLRAYTIIVVTEIAVITKAAPGRLMSFRGQPSQRRSDRGHHGARVDRPEGSCRQDNRPAGIAGHRADRGRSPKTLRSLATQRRPVRHQYARRMEPGRRS